MQEGSSAVENTESLCRKLSNGCRQVHNRWLD